MGRVDKKDSLLDYEQMERERGITVFSKEGVFKWKILHLILSILPVMLILQARWKDRYKYLIMLF